MYVERMNENGAKETLYHIQNKNICDDGTPYDVFVWSDHTPTKEDITNAFLHDYGCEYEWELEEWRTSSEVYPVVATSVKKESENG